MNKKLQQIPIHIESGSKYTTASGITAIKDGIKVKANLPSSSPPLKKPEWIKIKATHSPKYTAVKELVAQHKLSTVCAEAKCPNITECWSHGTATIMLLGAICTRACKFCAVDTGNPRGQLDPNEAINAAKTAQIMDLDYIVLTSVDRDDLPDGGATQYAAAIKEIKKACPNIKVEALTPDFNGEFNSVQLILDAGVDVFAQNLETVKRLTYVVRDPRAGYEQTLAVLAYAKSSMPQVFTKTSLMLGLGETIEEILTTMDDLRAVGVDILTLGQYLQPTKNHLAVERYVTPDEFSNLRQIGLKKGFYEVAAGPMVRSSYRADQVFNQELLL